MAVRQAEENDGEDDQDLEPLSVGMIAVCCRILSYCYIA